MTIRFAHAWLLLAVSTAAMAQTPVPSTPYGGLYANPYGSPAPAAARSAPVLQRLELGSKGHRYSFPVYASLRLNAPGALDKVRRLVLVLHDERREADRSLQTITALYAGQAGREAGILVVAPRFPNMLDAGMQGMPVWRRNNWMEGLPSIPASGRPAPVGAFQVIDDLLREFTAPGRLPALQAIVLAGHGAGAQMAQRYAVLNPLDESLRATGLRLSYVVANAESYLYLSPERPSRTGRGYGRYERGICPTYEHYRYGLEDLPAALEAYDGRLGRARLAARYAWRHVIYLLGEADNNPEYPGLDKSCGAEAQGATPLARGLGYWGYESRDQPHAPPHGALRTEQQGYVVLNVGHSETGIYSSACAAQALLGDGGQATAAACKALPAAQAAAHLKPR